MQPFQDFAQTGAAGDLLGLGNLAARQVKEAEDERKKKLQASQPTQPMFSGAAAALLSGGM